MKNQIIPALLLIISLTSTASAQTFRGTILGTVTDPNGGLVAGAKVTVTSVNTGHVLRPVNVWQSAVHVLSWFT